jgi:hypothetical protein
MESLASTPARAVTFSKTGVLEGWEVYRGVGAAELGKPGAMAARRRRKIARGVRHRDPDDGSIGASGCHFAAYPSPGDI